MKTFSLLAISLFITSVSFGQLMVTKLIGKNSGNSKLGYGTFAFYEIPISETGNQSIRIELLDMAFFARKDKSLLSTIGYVSIKGGYKKIFGESKTGFFIEPQAGWGRTVSSKTGSAAEKLYKDGLALAFEVGYSLGVGEKGNAFNFGLKYENDVPGSEYNAQSIGFRFSYSFGLFRRKKE